MKDKVVVQNQVSSAKILIEYACSLVGESWLPPVIETPGPDQTILSPIKNMPEELFLAGIIKEWAEMKKQKSDG